jgi:hypothetical protein
MVIWYILWLFGIFCVNLVYFTAIWSILWPFGIFCGHLVYLMVIWCIFPRFRKLYQEKSGNPERIRPTKQYLFSKNRDILMRRICLFGQINKPYENTFKTCFPESSCRKKTKIKEMAYQLIF